MFRNAGIQRWRSWSVVERFCWRSSAGVTVLLLVAGRDVRSEGADKQHGRAIRGAGNYRSRGTRAPHSKAARRVGRRHDPRRARDHHRLQAHGPRAWKSISRPARKCTRETCWCGWTTPTCGPSSQQAQAALTSAEAAYAQAASDEKRFAGLLKSNAVSRQDYEKTATALRSTEAELRRAKEIVNEVQVTLDWATIRSPMDGTVIDKKVDVGDLVRPGQMLVTLFDPKRMQLVASVRESLAQRLEVGQSIGVDIEGLKKQCTGTISEIVPEAQAASRAFQVKVTGPCPAGIYTGMFARMLIPLDEEQVLVVPRQAVRNVGQLELVDVVEDGHASRRAVRTGRTFDDDVEVLSGLREGEQVVVPGAASAAQEAEP